jgi:Family of unknown function (DUF5413)
MKRFAIFMLVGPAAGFVVFLLRQWLAGKFAGWEAAAFQLPIAYMFAFLPSLVMWFVDWLLFDKMHRWRRIVILALVGYAASIVMLLIWSPVQIHLPQLLIFGIVGAVQAALCSWLMGIDGSAWGRTRSQSAEPGARASST